MNSVIDEPIWKPLERLFSENIYAYKHGIDTSASVFSIDKVIENECAQYMYMGAIGNIQLYKHIVTRKYINIDLEGTCWSYDFNSNSYFQVPSNIAIKRAIK